MSIVTVVREPVEVRLLDQYYTLVHCSLISAFSVNYLISEDDMTVQDPTTALRRYDDKRTASGNVLKVLKYAPFSGPAPFATDANYIPCQRYFCSNCGRYVLILRKK